jgi:hypothetical protein
MIMKILATLMLLSTIAYGQNNSEKFKEQILKSADVNKTDIKNQLLNQDISPLLLKVENSSVLGFIGNEYERFRMKFVSVIKNKDNPYQYFVYGKNMVKDNVCEFQGTLTITNAFNVSDSEAKDTKKGLVLGTYVFFENPLQKHVGQFTGIFRTNWYIDKQELIQYDDLLEDADGFTNNEFVGTWKSYSGTLSKPCHWGDDRIPMSDDLDNGAGEFVPASKYITNGWQNYVEAYNGQNEKSEAARQKERFAWWK